LNSPDRNGQSRITTGHERCGQMMFKWKFKDNPECDFGNDSQRLITDKCPNRRCCIEGFNSVNEVTEETFEWIKILDMAI